MYCGIIVEVRIEFRTAFVYSILYTTVDKTGYTNAICTICTIKTHLCRKVNIFYTYIGVKHVFLVYFAVKCVDWLAFQ